VLRNEAAASLIQHMGRALVHHRDDRGPSAAQQDRDVHSRSCRPIRRLPIGPMTATAFVAVIDTPDRFISSDSIAD
jgi:hypothetical protein